MSPCVAVASISIFDDRHLLDEIVNGDETDQPVSLHHGNVGAVASSLSDISRLIVSASRAVTLRSGYGRSPRHPRRGTQVPMCEASAD